MLAAPSLVPINIYSVGVIIIIIICCSTSLVIGKMTQKLYLLVFSK